MQDPEYYIFNMIWNYLLGSDVKKNTTLIKVHNMKLSQVGEISFPCNADIWANHSGIPLKSIRANILGMLAERNANAIQRLHESSQEWLYPLTQVKIIKDRCALFLSRKQVTENLLQQVLLSETYGAFSKDPKKCICVKKSTSSNHLDNISEYRALLINRTIKKIIELSDWTEVGEDSEENINNIIITSVASRGSNCETTRSTAVIICGAVLDPADKKLAKISAEEYIRLRSNDMRLMAMHRYGVRKKHDEKFCELFEKLGKAAATVDLLEVKPSSPVFITRSGQGSTKGASFILYNSARLETLLRAFDEKVKNDKYEKLPPLNAINAGLLSSEEEWELIFGYIFTFPGLIRRCIENIQTGSCQIHNLVRYLNGLVSSFSVYYRRIKILTETRSHLMPHVYSRIYLLKAIQKIFNMTLGFFDIESVQFM